METTVGISMALIFLRWRSPTGTHIRSRSLHILNCIGWCRCRCDWSFLFRTTINQHWILVALFLNSNTNDSRLHLTGPAYDPPWLALDQLAALLAGSLPSLCPRTTQAQLLIPRLSTTFNTVSNPDLVCWIPLMFTLITVQDVDESIYLAIQVIGGHILLPLLVITILLKKTINRHPVFVNFCVSWIFSSVVYSMLCV